MQLFSGFLFTVMLTFLKCCSMNCSTVPQLFSFVDSGLTVDLLGGQRQVSYTVISVMALSCHLFILFIYLFIYLSIYLFIYLLFIFILAPVLLLGRVNKTLKKKWTIIIDVSSSVILSNFFSVFLFSSPHHLHSFFPFFQFSESRDRVCTLHCSTLDNQHITR